MEILGGALVCLVAYRLVFTLFGYLRGLRMRDYIRSPVYLIAFDAVLIFVSVASLCFYCISSVSEGQQGYIQFEMLMFAFIFIGIFLWRLIVALRIESKKEDTDYKDTDGY